MKPNLGVRRELRPASGPVPRIYVMVDDPPSYLERAVQLGATTLWTETHREEFDGRHAAFRDPWGAEVVLWRDKGTYKPGAPSA